VLAPFSTQKTGLQKNIITAVIQEFANRSSATHINWILSIKLQVADIRNHVNLLSLQYIRFFNISGVDAAAAFSTFSMRVNHSAANCR